jgi:hypothetical protein
MSDNLGDFTPEQPPHTKPPNASQGRRKWWLYGLLLVAAIGAGAAITAANPNTSDKSARSTVASTRSPFQADVDSCTAIITPRIEDTYLQTGQSGSANLAMIQYYGMQSPIARVYGQMSAEYDGYAIQRGVQAANQAIPAKVLAACQAAYTTLTPKAIQPAPSATVTSTTASLVGPVDSAASKACAEKVSSLLREVITGTKTISQAKGELPEIIPRAALDNAVEGVQTYMQSDHLTQDAAIDQASGPMTYQCAAPH